MASVLPGTGRSTARPTEPAANDATVSNYSAGNDGNLRPSDRSELDNTDLTAAVRSVFSVCKSIAEQTRRMEQRLAGVKQKQGKITEALKELTELIKKQEKTLFSTKGSSLEVSVTSQE